MNTRTLLVFFHDVAAACLAWLAAYWLRFNLELPERFALGLLDTIGPVVAVQSLFFFTFGLYRGIWRFASLPDLKRIVTAVGLGALAAPIRDNEIRVEFLGISVSGIIHTKVIIAGVLGGLGGALAAMSIGHVDPNMAYWTTSGGFVFVTVLAGSGYVAAAFVGSLAFEALRSFAVDVMPQLWQMTLGSVLLLTILFLPEGLGSLVSRLRQRRAVKP